MMYGGIFFMTMITKQEQWRKRIDECTISGLSIQEWCKINTVSPDQYHYWKRKFNKLNNGIQKSETQWAPLLIEKPTKPSVPEPAITLQAGPFRVDVTKGFDKQTLTDLIQILGTLC